jgi:hypothetical protein
MGTTQAQASSSNSCLRVGSDAVGDLFSSSPRTIACGDGRTRCARSSTVQLPAISLCTRSAVVFARYLRIRRAR